MFSSIRSAELFVRLTLANELKNALLAICDDRNRYGYAFKYTNDAGNQEEKGGLTDRRETANALHMFAVDWGYDQIIWRHDDKWIVTYM